MKHSRLIVLFLVALVRADESVSTIVLKLFTSEGSGSCPEPMTS